MPSVYVQCSPVPAQASHAREAFALRLIEVFPEIARKGRELSETPSDELHIACLLQQLLTTGRSCSWQRLADLASPSVKTDLPACGFG